MVTNLGGKGSDYQDDGGVAKDDSVASAAYALTASKFKLNAELGLWTAYYNGWLTVVHLKWAGGDDDQLAIVQFLDTSAIYWLYEGGTGKREDHGAMKLLRFVMDPAYERGTVDYNDPRFPETLIEVIVKHLQRQGLKVPGYT